ncbi:hypothetical protein [Persephonella sp.]
MAKIFFLVTIIFIIFSGCASKQEKQLEFTEYNPLMEEYENIISDKKTKNVFKGGLLGGSGKTITATFSEIVSIAVKEAVIENKEVRYNCEKCKDNYIKVIATPKKIDKKCSIVKVKYIRREFLIKEEKYRVCRKI